jgi:hypothetical protein
MPAVGLRWKIPRLAKREAQRRLVEAILPERTEEHAPAIQVVRSDHRWEFGKRVEGIR